MSIKNSTIFTTKNKELAIFGQTLSDVKKKLIDFNDVWMQGGRYGSNKAQIIPEENLTKVLSFDKASEQLNQFNKYVVQGGMSLDDYFNRFQKGNTVLRTYVTTTDQQAQSTQGLVKASQEARAAQIAQNEAIQASTLYAKAATVATKALAVAGNMIAMWGISEAIKLVSDLATASDRLKESAEELGQAFSSTKSDIDAYKGKIQDLYETINDSNSSYEDTYNARQELLSIQDEMIEKFGNEAEAVKLVTDAINGQVEALDTLTAKEWQETVNKFNNDPDRTWTEKAADNWSNLINGVSSNYDRMIKEMEDTEISFSIIPTNDDNYKEFVNKLKETYGASLTKTERSDIFTLSGDLDTIYNQLLDIQSLASDMGFDDSWMPDLGRQAEEAKTKLEDYQEFYSQAILNDRILTNDAYTELFKSINDAYADYQEAFSIGDEDAIESAKQNFAEIVQSATDGIDDQSVVDFFNSMYPDLQEVVGGWEFEVKFKAAIDDDNDNFENKVKDAVSKFDTVEDIQNYNPKISTDEQINAYHELKTVADEYGLSLDQLIDKMVQMGFIQSQAKEDLRNKLSNDGQDLIVDDWIDTLTDEEVKLANSKEFEQALEEQKNKINGATLSAEDYTAALQSVKDAQNSIDADEPDTPSLSISETIDQLNTQLKPVFDSLKSAYQDIFTLDDNGNEAFTLENVDLSMLDSIKSDIDELNSMEDVDINIDYSSFENLAKVLTDSSSTADDVHNAINALATEIVDSLNPSLSQCSGESYKMVQSILESVGIMNSEQVMISSLGYTYEEYIAAKEEASNVGFDLANATESEINAFVQEAIEAGNCGEALALLQLKKLLVNSTQINTAADVQQIMNLASAAGMGAEVLTQLANAKNILSTVENGGTVSMASYEKALSDVEAAKQTMLDWKPVEIDFGDIGGGTSGASSAGSEAGDAYVDAFEDELSKLDTLKERGKITEKEYLDYLRALYEKYFKDIDGYAEEFAENQYKYLSSMKSLYESTLSGITSMLDKQISAYEDQKDAAIDALEAERDGAIEVLEVQKEQLQTQIDLIDKQISAKEKVIDAIQDEIDAMEEANDERERQITLQQAQYNLERMQNQRTILQYSEEKGMHYVQDTSEIRDAKQDVEDAEFEIEIANKEKQISLIEKEVELLEEKKDSINDQINLLDDQIDKIEEYYDKLISDTEEYWDNLINGMEDYKSRWEELSELEENAKLMATLKELGITTEDILGMSEDAFSKFRDEYVGILADIYSGNDTMTNVLADSLGTTTDKLGSYIQSTQGYIDSLNGSANELQPVVDALNNTADGMSNLASFASDANANVSKTATSVGTVADNVNIAADNVGTLKENLNEVSTLITDEQTAFDNLKQKIDEVIEAVNQKTKAIEEEQTAVGIVTSSEIADFLLLKEKILEIKESLDSISESVSTLDATPINNLTNAFQSLYDKLLLVSTTLGVGMEASENGAVSSITSAIQSLNNISLEKGIIAQFDNLKTSIDSVSSAISGGDGESSGGESQGGNSGSAKGDESGSKGSGGSGSSLTNAITKMGETASEVIGEPEAEGDGTVIGEFGSLKTAVDDVSSAIGSGDSEGSESSQDSESDNLIGSITNLGEQTEEILGDSGGDGVIGRFEEFKDVIGEANEHVTGISEGLAAIDGQEVECTITVNIKTNGSLPSAIGAGMNLGSATYDAKYLGNAHVEGTALASGNWAVQSDEKNALVGEEGFEIIVRNGRFFTIGDNGAEMTNIQKGDIVFNHEQSKNLLKNGHISGRGKAYADGTVGGGKSLTPDGRILCPLQPGDKIYDMIQKFDSYMKSIDNNVEKFVPNTMYEQNRQIHDIINQISNSNMVNNNQPAFTINGGINITCPGVTSKEVMSQVGTALEKEFSGMALKAYQKVNITR